MARTYHHGDKNKQRIFGPFWRWLQSEPSWWHKLYTHTPARRLERDKLKRLDEDDYPDRKKPHVYYW